MPFSRHEKRKLLVQALFLLEFGHFTTKDPLDALKYCWEKVAELNLKNQLDEFDTIRMVGTVKHLSEIKLLTAKYAPDWPLDQIAPCDRIIFFLAYFELLHTDTPGPVVINEAVELAKEFGGDRSSRFINGALSAAFKDLAGKMPEKERRDGRNATSSVSQKS